MKIGFLCSEYFGVKDLSKPSAPTTMHGGFGYLTRFKCEQLARMGHEVHAFIPAYAFSKEDNNDRTIEINNVNVHLYKMATHLDGFSFSNTLRQLSEGRNEIKSLQKFLCDYPMDVYQSEEPTSASLQVNRHSEKQVVVFQDPFDDADLEELYNSHVEYERLFSRKERRRLQTLAGEVYHKWGGRLADQIYRRWPVTKLLSSLPKSQVYAEARFISEKVRQMYNLPYNPGFMPNPANIPPALPKKSDSPLIVWIARWDPQKRVHVGLDVASRLPEYDFYFVGTSTDYAPYKLVQEKLRRKYEKFSNIHVLDFISEEEKISLLDKAWILLNTSCREGLPMTFIEAGGRGACIISSVDPDRYASLFGAHVTEESEFRDIIEQAVTERWHEVKGPQAHDHMMRIHESQKVIRENVEIFRSVIDKQPKIHDSLSVSIGES